MKNPFGKPTAQNGPVDAATRRIDRARRKASAPFFFGKQALLFAAVCLFVLVLDLFLYIGISIYDSNLHFGGGSPKSITRDIGNNLAKQEDGTYTIPDDTIAWMQAEDCWALLISNEGEPIWSHEAPEEVLHSYTLADAATFSRLGYLEDYPCFVWHRDDGLLVAGFPKDSYAVNVLSYLPQESMLAWPLYVLLIFFVDAAVLFLVYSVSKRRVMKSTAPMIEALDALAHEKPVYVQLKGTMRDVGDSINAASAIMRRKDEARKRWVTGVSHDVRTPLAISLGHAERIAQNDRAPEEVREQARAIMRQNERIRDLVSDLNIASKLEYDMQPVDLRPVRPAKLLRGIAADYANTYTDGRFEFEADIDESCEGLELLLDERLIDRALRNLVNNAIRHNDEGCTVDLVARLEQEQVIVGVSDDGSGLSQEAIARLNQEASDIVRLKSAIDDFPIAGPTPPPHFAEYRPEKAAELAGRMAALDNQEPLEAAADTAATPENPVARMQDRENAADDAAETPSLAPKDLIGINEHGLGLSLVTRIAAAHGGRMEFLGDDAWGFSAFMVLPVETDSIECDTEKAE